MRWLELKVPPPVVTLIIATGMWGISPPQSVTETFQLVRIFPASPFVLLGAFCGMSALGSFIRHRTSIDPHHPAKTSCLVVTGLYRHTRNPMYLGLCLLLIGWVILLGAPVALFGPAMFVVYLTRFQIQPEERLLLERFGKDYEAYCKKVRRWL
jgi:protein-S-isoprenylcysteine O-methyltransferase Ste14